MPEDRRNSKPESKEGDQIKASTNHIETITGRQSIGNHYLGYAQVRVRQPVYHEGRIQRHQMTEESSLAAALAPKAGNVNGIKSS